MRLDCKDIVHRVLLNNHFARDDDMYLIAKVWEEQLEGQSVPYNVALMGGKCSNPSSIVRTRKIIQNAYEETRGTKFEKRKAHAKDVVKQIRDMEEDIRSEDI